jgi:hypothetical protein
LAEFVDRAAAVRFVIRVILFAVVVVGVVVLAVFAVVVVVAVAVVVVVVVVVVVAIAVADGGCWVVVVLGIRLVKKRRYCRF